MKWLGYQRFEIDAVEVDKADIKRRSKTAQVAELADSIRRNGEEPIQAPTVRQGGVLVCGRDRMAALLILKAPEVWAHVVNCTDDEAKELELSENIYRRADNRSELIAQLVALKEQHLRATGDSVPDSRRASDKQIKVAARRQVAKAAGISPASVKKAEARALAASRLKPITHSRPFGQAATRKEEPPIVGGVDSPSSPSDATPPTPTGLPVDFETFGADIPEARRHGIKAAHVVMTKQLVAVGWVEDWAAGELAIGSPFVSKIAMAGIRTAAEALALAISNARPAALCAECRGAGCSRCHRVGVVGRFGNEGATTVVAKLNGHTKVSVIGPEGRAYTQEQLGGVK